MSTDICYWKHEIKNSESFLCYDGKSTVCSRCCVEECAKETPQWFAACARAGHPTWPSVDRGRRVPSKLVVLESYWDNRLFQTMTVKGFFESMGPMHIHRCNSPTALSSLNVDSPTILPPPTDSYGVIPAPPMRRFFI